MRTILIWVLVPIPSPPTGAEYEHVSHPTGETPVAEAPDAAPAVSPDAVSPDAVSPEAAANADAEAEPEGAAEAGPDGGPGQRPLDNTFRNAVIGGVVGVFLVAGAMVATALGLPVPWTGSGADYGAAREIPISDSSAKEPDLEEEWVPVYLVRSSIEVDAGDEPTPEARVPAVSPTTASSADSGATPVANDDTITIRANTTVNLYVLDNDSDADRNLTRATLALVSGPSHAMRFSVEDDHFRYRPQRDGSERFVPEDSFVYEVCDPTGLCDTAIVTILVVSS
jgi:hypothetical protein